ncbi:flocculation protein FLO11-like isoform X3 [Zootermopsis nevadensis]|uniref:flocculation protein FLO11-like isoform X3 n=1 Tax=Zootermopsis nevadensis TaxID=136037 RepID=UPI000B8E490D|nr:flocculation protein FLO11-like isoform X3 [Zootermopsis nevadensis]
MGGFAWVTLATNDSYSLGALVLGHSLRRAGSPHDLVVLVTPGVSAAMRNQLSSIFTLVQEVNVLDSHDEANLALLERPELGITFTKLHCWRLTQYDKCVFLDADTLVLKNSDELFERDELSAAPDPGWPDCFNSGVFVYRPSLDTFNDLIKFALSKGSFDGGDQGLLNLFFSDWATKDISRHLPFIYNMVSTATYSYLPAYKQFGEGAKIVHFIGSNKPWLQYFDSETRLVRPPQGSEHLQNLLQLWWDIFCSTVHPSLSPDMLGLAGALAKVTLGVPRSAEQAAFEEHMRKQAWEQGSIDYMGRDSFDNIWRKITETLAQAPSKPQAQKPATAEIPLTIPVPVPILPEPKSTTLPLTDADDAPGITSSTTDPTAPALQSTQHSEPPLPEPSEPAVPPVSFKGPVLPPSSGEQAVNVGQSIPHTPLITEATPPTSPPIGVPAADSKALTVDVQPLETPPVESTTSKMLSETQIPAPTTQVTQTSEFPVQTEAKLIEQESIQLISKELAAVAEIEATEQKEALSSSQQLIPTHEIPTAPVTVETKLSDAPSPSQQIPTEQESPVAAPTLQILPTQESPSTPVAPPIPQILPAQESTSTPVASSTPIQTSTQEFPVAAPALQILPTQESPSTPVAPSTPIQEVPVAAPTPQILLAQESTSTPVATSTPIQTSTQEVPVSTPAPQILPTQESPSTPVAPSTPIQEVPIAAPTPQILSTQESPSTLVAPSTPIQTSTQESPSTPVVLSTTIPAPTHEVPAAPIVYQELPPTPPASPGTVETKPVETPPSTLTPVLPGKTEAKPVKQKKSPPAPVEHTKSPSAPPTQEGVQQGVATAVQPPIPLQEVPISMTTDKTKPTIAETVPVAEKQGPQPSLTTEQKVDPPILLSSAPSSDSKELPKIPTVAKAASEDPTPTVRSKKELSSVQDVPKRAAETRSSVGQKDTPVPSPQSKPEEPSKSVPTKPSAPVSPPSSPDASPSDQAPIPPKRRGHKGPGTSATDQGAAGKPASQSQPSKASKQGQKGKK